MIRCLLNGSSHQPKNTHRIENHKGKTLLDIANDLNDIALQKAIMSWTKKTNEDELQTVDTQILISSNSISDAIRNSYLSTKHIQKASDKVFLDRKYSYPTKNSLHSGR